MQKIAISITPQYHKILQYLDINIDIWLGNGIIAQPWSVLLEPYGQIIRIDTRGCALRMTAFLGPILNLWFFKSVVFRVSMVINRYFSTIWA